MGTAETARGVLQTTFRPFSYKGFSLCPSCTQKRTLLFAEVSRLIYKVISEFCNAAAGKPLLSGVIAAHQTFGDQSRAGRPPGIPTSTAWFWREGSTRRACSSPYHCPVSNR